MEKPEYREAWAWTHFLLRGDPRAKGVLLDYLRDLRADPAPPPLLPRLAAVFPDPPAALAGHLARLSAGR
jgi:hypothetical protein